MSASLNNILKKSKEKRYSGRKKIIGRTEYHKNFRSEILKNERDIILWLPPSYFQEINRRYPVLYMHDGQNLFDPDTSYAGMDWQVDETASKLIKKDKIKEIIVVGINNTADRLEEYSFGEKADKYIRFITEELKPFIDKNYRTKNDRENTAVIGSSMGGLISFIIAWKHPEIFSKAGCMSSSFYYNNEKVFSMIDEYKGEKKQIKYYIDHGEDGLLRGQKMFCKLTQLGYIIGTDVDYFYAPGAEHNEKEWAKRLERPLVFFFGK